MKIKKIKKKENFTKSRKSKCKSKFFKMIILQSISLNFPSFPR